MNKAEDDNYTDEESDHSHDDSERTVENRPNLNDAIIEDPLPAPIRKRVAALKRLQYATIHLEADFQRDVFNLQAKYNLLLTPFYIKRDALISGQCEPCEGDSIVTPMEQSDRLATTLNESTLDNSMMEEFYSAEMATPDMSKVDDDILDMSSSISCSANLATSTPIPTKGGDQKQLKPLMMPLISEDAVSNIEKSYPSPTHGIKSFWLTTFKNVRLMAEFIEEHDEPALSHLENITLTYQEEPMSFSFEFNFSPNNYFHNTVLNKVYYMQCQPDPEDPFKFNGPEIYKCTGCDIEWKEGRNLTVIHDTDQDNSEDATSQTDKPTFFNFFTPPEVPDSDCESLPKEADEILMCHYEMGICLRDCIIPKAVLYFTGELQDASDESCCGSSCSEYVPTRRMI